MNYWKSKIIREEFGKIVEDVHICQGTILKKTVNIWIKCGLENIYLLVTHMPSKLYRKYPICPKIGPIKIKINDTSVCLDRAIEKIKAEIEPEIQASFTLNKVDE